MKMFILILIASVALLQLASARIYCNDRGECTGSGSPAEDTRCSGCHSCSYKGCCHVRFTNPYTYCNIPGWRSNEFRNIHE